MSYTVRTQKFTGPFDLLLSLVTRQKVAIGSIAIAEVADQYLAEVEQMQSMDLEVASDFLLVASTLLEIKATSLVPEDFRVKAAKSDDFEDDADLDEMTPEQARDILIARLIAYKQFRNVSNYLNQRGEAESRMHPRVAGADPEFLNIMPDYLSNVTLVSLAVICADLSSQREEMLLQAAHIAPKRLPVALTVASVDRMTRSTPITTFTKLLAGATTPETIVVTFLAILELYKRGSIKLIQDEAFKEINVERVHGAPAYEIENVDEEELEEYS